MADFYSIPPSVSYRINMGIIKETDGEKRMSLPSSQQSFWPHLANSSHVCFLLQFQRLAPRDHPMTALCTRACSTGEELQEQ